MDVNTILLSYVLPAAIGFFGAILGSLVSLFATRLTLRFSYRQLFAETVSNNRMEWINVWRENISTFLACAEVLHGGNAATGDCTLYNLYRSRAMITSRLNLEEELHQIMLAAINSLDWSQDNAQFAAQREYILETARQILKPEWERVKREAKGKNK